DQWIVVGDVYAETRELLVAESARWTVDRVGDQNVVARSRHREQRERDCRQSRWHRERGVAAFERRHRTLQIGDGRQSVKTIADAGILAALGRLEIGHALEKHRRGAVDRSVDRTQMLARIATKMGDLGCGPRLAPPAHTVERSAAAICAACASVVW